MGRSMRQHVDAKEERQNIVDKFNRKVAKELKRDPILSEKFRSGLQCSHKYVIKGKVKFINSDLDHFNDFWPPPVKKVSVSVAFKNGKS